jgi:retinol dehydrogenase 12
VTADGIETTFAVNHLGYFLLTQLLLERLIASAPARIVNVASDAHRFAGGRLAFDNLNGDKRYSAMGIYGQSKLANILFTRELARRLQGSGVTVNCLHPGTVATRFAQNNSGFYSLGTRLIAPFIRTPEKGAETAVYLCAAAEVQGVSGAYFYNCREKRPSRAARNDDDARRLWEVSAEMCHTTV